MLRLATSLRSTILLLMLALSVTHCADDDARVNNLDDDARSDAVDTVRVNTAPLASIITPVATDLVPAGSPVDLRVEVSDDEQTMSELVVTCYIDAASQQVSEGSPTDDGVYEDTFTAPQVGGSYTLTCSVTDGADGQTDVSVTFGVNTAPGAPVVAITPESPATTDSLTVEVTQPAADPDRASDQLTQTITWLRDGEVTEYTDATVPAEATEKGQVWSVEVFASDGLVDGSLGVAEVTIQNTMPVAPEVAIAPSELTVADTATCELITDGEDIDGDELVLTYFWSLNGEALDEGDGATLALSDVTLDDGSLPKAGDSLTCGVSASDDLVSTEVATSAEVVLIAADICSTEANPCAADAACTNNDTVVPDCACNPGFDGDGLTCTEIDECAAEPCLNGGTCTDAVNAFTCECVPGYEGDTCETDTDECADAPCLNGGTCTDAVNAFTCACAPGYEGDTCETDIDECADSPCMNDGTCTDAVNGFVCACAPGYEGDTCETDIDECAAGPCLNGGTCTEGIASFTCACGLGYEGDTCEINIDECADAPCLNGGTCADGVNAFTCACAAGYEGDTCETDIDECANAPCMNGGTCTDAVNGFVCACAPGYEGDTCETDIDECAASPCQNGGTCTDAVNGYECECSPGFGGDSCEVKSDVHYLIVGGGGRGGATWGSSNNGGGGAGGLMTSWGDINGGGEPVGSTLQLVSGVTYTITVGEKEEDSSVIGGDVSLTATRGNNGGGAPSAFTGGSGGHAGQYGYSGTGSNGQTGGGGGGAGGSAYNPSGGSPLVSNITGSDVEYAEGGYGEGQGFGEYGAPTGKGPGGGGSGNDYYDNKAKVYVGSSGRDGIVILRVPTVLAGQASGAATTTVGSDTVFTWKESGSYTP